MLIFFGENVVASRAAFLAAKQAAAAKSASLVQLNGDTLTLDQLVSSLQTISLLGDTNQVFIEGFFSRRPSNDKKAITEYLLSHTADPVYLWDGKDVATAVKSFPAPVIKKFELPKVIFQFIDTFSLETYRQALVASEPEMILGLMARRLHDLILFSEHRLELPAWQQQKLALQARRWPLAQLLVMNNQLLELDYAQKTSTTPFDLAAALELWLIKLNNKST